MKVRLAIIALALVFGQNVFAQTCPDMQFNSSASVWDNAVSGPNLIPISADTPNGNFTICNHAGVQFGLRIDERYVGPITPTAGTGDYVAPMGDNGDGSALWNITGHLDFGYAYGSGVSPDELGDTTTIMQYDCDPFIGSVDGPTIDLSSNLIGLVVPSTTVLFQITDNIGFALRCPDFDPTADGSYEFSATIQDSNGAIIAETYATAIVGSPVAPPPVASRSVPTLSQWSLILMAMLLGMVAVIGLRRKTR